ncbi:AraC family transcriptional regulator [Leptospira sp. 2 VSF19]|uniref:AraC family transcriptional regulator n=1 Tax=Leptospira soteropolitanensis TaxID=2950025 RepID=A0AAW5VQC2_9LEPT|nr:AraC family transcriptional regulator [Leptospira soteropolitanensis]MCW7493507.1 AraC family transcriptional regulator [Leptospira soteropolitanensis]MCW7500961.1 AraC family transcriptional regulator [Leptospira soteropolitanensis]MCW7523359.1 AraC family transcriptional regulator [Leptospira soteropolitanensis]MCW7527220.1 AraC family transcriptional regulator [Leptospira soteropolitanensis]MCW7531077.1 AraC family transcriptional regulator [Leptospira soteropolitanensis]
MEIFFIKPPSFLEFSIKEFWIWKDVNVKELPWILPSYECEMVFHLGNPPIVETEDKQVICLPMVHLVGPQTRRWRILSDFNLSLIAIRFYVGGLYSLFSKRGDELQNQFSEMKLDLMLGGLSEIKKKILLNENSSSNIICKDDIVVFLTSFLETYPGKPREIPAFIRFALFELKGPNVSIESLCKKLGISRKQLDRKFKEIVGMAPSEFRTVHRLLEMVRNPEHYRENNPNLRFTDLAQEFNYSDQSHFNHDFKKKSGNIPNEWFAEYEKMSHFYKGDSSYTDRINK